MREQSSRCCRWEQRLTPCLETVVLACACDEPEPDMFKVEASFHSSPCLRLSKKWNGLTSPGG